MRVYLLKEQMLSVINKKEEMDENTILVTDEEAELITETLFTGGYVWAENGEVRVSPPKPNRWSIWNNNIHCWEEDQALKNIEKQNALNEFITKLKAKRKAIADTGVYIKSIDKKVETTQLARNNYTQMLLLIKLGLNQGGADNRIFTTDGIEIAVNQNTLQDILLAIKDKDDYDNVIYEMYLEKAQEADYPNDISIENYWYVL